jgi:hypothetical protein
MRILTFLIVALVLPSEVFAASKNSITVEGCVRNVGTCLILNTGGGSNYWLSGRNLSEVRAGQHLIIGGRVGSPNRGYKRCPTRLIVSGEIRVSSVSPTPGLCLFQ